MFLGEGHETSERRTWAVIWLCAAMMVAEIVGGWLFGSIALVADGLHMSTHAGALLLAALAYTFARRHADDPRFTFGTGKFGDLAGFTSAIILAMIALLIGYEAVTRLFAPVPIHFAEAIPIAVLGLAVNIASAWLLGGGDHHAWHGHGHGHAHGACARPRRGEADRDAGRRRRPRGVRGRRPAALPAARRIRACRPPRPPSRSRRCGPDGARQTFAFVDRGGFLESVDEIPEPHAFAAHVTIDGETHAGRLRGARACAWRGRARQQSARGRSST